MTLPTPWVGAGLGIGVVFGLAAVVAAGLSDAFADPDSTSPQSPVVAWKYDRRYATVVGLVAGLVAGLVFGLVAVLEFGLVTGLLLGLGFGLATGVGFGLAASRVWSSTLAIAQLTREWNTPMHFMSFLDDARERNVLRTVGPVYQFRHARLQDRLAAEADSCLRLPEPSRPLGHAS